MKACKFCGTQADNTAQHCPSCGSALFLHICENCGSHFDSGFCPNCGTKAGAEKKVCPDCRTVYFSPACPNCGYTPRKTPITQKVEQTVVHKHVYEQTPTPTQARQANKNGKGCGCLAWIMIIVVVLVVIGSLIYSRISTTYTKTTTNSSVKTTERVTKDPSITAAPTATPEPAIANAQEIVDQYFSKASDSEIEMVKAAESALAQYEAKESGKVLLVSRSYAEDRGTVGKRKYEPNYIGALGYAAVYEDQDLESDKSFGITPWKIPTYKKDKQFWEKTGTIDHKTEVVVIGQELEMPKRSYSNSRCSGYLHVIRMDTGDDCWLAVSNFVTSLYWEQSLEAAQEKGYCIATFNQVSDFYPVTKRKEKAALEDGTLVLLPMKSTISASSPDKKNNPIAGIVVKEWKYGLGGVTVFFNEDDLNLTY